MGQSIKGFKKGLQDEVPDDDDDKLLAKGETAQIEKGEHSAKS